MNRIILMGNGFDRAQLARASFARAQQENKIN